MSGKWNRMNNLESLDSFMDFESLALRCYSPEEIQQLSVIQVTQTKTFDEVNYPIKGGLYDPAMGPIENFDNCETCTLPALHCPGHMGHIQLEVPAFNPLLFKFTYNLLKGTCANCHKFMCKTSGVAARVIIAQLKCLDMGMVDAALDIQRNFKESKKRGDHDIEVSFTDELAAMSELESALNALNAKIEKRKTEQAVFRPTKVSHNIRTQLIREFTRDHLFKRKVKCNLCGFRNGTMRNENSRFILLDFSLRSDESKKKEVKKTLKQLSIERILRGADKGIFPEEEDDDLKDDKKNIPPMDAEIQDPTRVCENALSEQIAHVKNGFCKKLAWRASEVREHLRSVWKKDSFLLKKLFPFFDGLQLANPIDILFMDIVAVPATKYRPIRFFKGDRFEHPQTVNLRRILEANEILSSINTLLREKEKFGEETYSQLRETIMMRVQGKTMNEKMHNAYLELQLRVNAVYDQELCMKNDSNSVPGLKQILEKKEGLFRMHMMGKRVNYACRSVITPDPYLDIDEIGIPIIFATRLTFGEPVNFLNTQKLRKLVQRGPDVHPGANFTSEGLKKKVIKKEDERERFATAKLLGLPTGEDAPVVVHRHLDRGDSLLMNRQPSLHKPSIMGHRARILKGMRTLRMNYAPCKAYNADFDGDEMNGHFIQDRIGQTEAAELANVGSNYLVPKDGTPILGLIQDHVVSGVLMTMRGRFFNKEDFMHLVLAAFAETSQRIEIPPPTILKPQKLWSGKHIISTIIKNCVPKGAQLINLKSKAKTPLNCWQVKGHNAPSFEMSESEVIFRQGELLSGVLDKSHYGASQYGLIHCCYELYGHRVATKILSCFSRVFTTYLQFHGFSLGVADILVTNEANDERKKAIKELRKIGDSVTIKAFALDEDASRLKIKHTMAMAYNNPRHDQTDVAILDYTMKKEVTKYNDIINKSCVPAGLIRSFPDNALQMMIQSGAKGSLVNSIQISCALGQIELEGKRPPLTAVGQTLPSFKAFDTSPRAGGFVDQRFLTGINPQELFFHTMAGREGLIDTAVKTSRSGYLQRCIIKHLEGIVAHYDQTVRDHDNTVIQFRYGEDGMDVGRAIFLNPKQFDFLENNLKAVRASATMDNISESEWKVRESEKQFKKIRRWKKKHGANKKDYSSAFTVFSEANAHIQRESKAGLHPLVEKWYTLTPDEKAYYESHVVKKCPEIVNDMLNPSTTLGALPEKMLEDVDKHMQKTNASEEFRRTIFWKGLRALTDPGENVGLLAAQSIGEPSTQMTLNTFHFAGRGEMNVTLGIPRLREILMTEGRNATPQAEIVIKPDTSPEVLEKIKQELNRVYMKQVIRKFALEEKLNIARDQTYRHYLLTLELLRQKSRDQNAQHLSREFILCQIELRFFKHLAGSIQKQMTDISSFETMTIKKLRATNMQIFQDDHQDVQRDDAESSDDEMGGREADAEEARLNQRHHDDAAEYQGEEEDRGDVQPEKKIEDEFEEILDDSEIEENDELAERSTIVDEEISSFIQTKRSRPKGEAEATRVEKVIRSSNLVSNYAYDTKSNRWCQVTIQLPVKRTKLDLLAIVEREVDEFIVSQTPDIEKCLIDEEKRNGKDVKILKTQGVNFQAFFKYANYLDVNTIYTNDLQTILNFYGVEACTKAITKEMNNVFSAYGIEVNPRHLTLTADYMTATGKISPFNRATMAHSPSPLQKMTFETTSVFLRDAVLQGEQDYLKSPSARLVTGQMMRGGTGAFDLLLDKRYMAKNSKNAKAIGYRKLY